MLPPDADVPRLKHSEREHGGVQQIAEFMCEKAEALTSACGFLLCRRLVALTCKLCDCDSDRIVQARVQQTKIVCANRRLSFDCQFSNGLAHISVVVDHLRDGESLLAEIVPV